VEDRHVRASKRVCQVLCFGPLDNFVLFAAKCQKPIHFGTHAIEKAILGFHSDLLRNRVRVTPFFEKMPSFPQAEMLKLGQTCFQHERDHHPA
jgi:hypothetical protein